MGWGRVYIPNGKSLAFPTASRSVTRVNCRVRGVAFLCRCRDAPHACSPSLQGTHKSLKGNAHALATVTAIIDGTGSVGTWAPSAPKAGRSLTGAALARPAGGCPGPGCRGDVRSSWPARVSGSEARVSPGRGSGRRLSVLLGRKVPEPIWACGRFQRGCGWVAGRN